MQDILRQRLLVFVESESTGLACHTWKSGWKPISASDQRRELTALRLIMMAMMIFYLASLTLLTTFPLASLATYDATSCHLVRLVDRNMDNVEAIALRAGGLGPGAGRYLKAHQLAELSGRDSSEIEAIKFRSSALEGRFIRLGRSVMPSLPALIPLPALPSLTSTLLLPLLTASDISSVTLCL